MADIAGFVTPLATLTARTIKHYVTLFVLAFSVLVHNLRAKSEFLSSDVRNWFDAQDFRNYTIVTQSLAQQYQSISEASQCLLQQWLTATGGPLYTHLSAKIASAEHVLTEILGTSKAWAFGAFDHLGNLMSGYKRTAIVRCIIFSHLAFDSFAAAAAWISNGTRFAAGLMSAYHREIRKFIAAIRAEEARITKEFCQWLLDKAARCRTNALLTWAWMVESGEELIHCYRMIDPQVFAWIKLFYIVVLLIYYRSCIRRAYIGGRAVLRALIAYFLRFISPLSQLHTMQLEMTFRKSMAGAYVYGHDGTEQWPSAYHFRNTLQPPAPRKPPAFATLPPAILDRIFTTALTSASDFSWHPLTHSLRLATPSITFHRAWRLARSLGHAVLPGNTIHIDACGGTTYTTPPSPRSPSFFGPGRFVARPASGREQLLDMLAVLALPAVARRSWMDRVAESMRLGRQWVIVVREDVERVWSFDLGLIVSALRSEGFGKMCGGVRVEYRIVVGERPSSDGEDWRWMRKVEEMVRQLREAKAMGYMHERLTVVVDGEEELMGKSLEERRMKDVVSEVVKELNVGE